jgi:hypothetical protein
VINVLSSYKSFSVAPKKESKHKIYNNVEVIDSNMVNYDRPLGISLLAYFLLALALIIITASVYVFLYESEFWDVGLLQNINSSVQRFLVTIFFASLLLVSSIGLLKTSPGGRRLLLILCLVTGIHGLSVASSELLRGVVILGICTAVIFYSLTSSVSAVFQPMDSRKAVESIDALESYRRVRSIK